MSPERDPFAHFERMRRQMDALLGDAGERAVAVAMRRRGFQPPVDVYYAEDPPRAVVGVELAGVDADRVHLQIEGRRLLISGQRAPDRAEGRVYQQVEIENGPFRRLVELGADVDADAAHAGYEDGMLVITLPLLAPQRRARTLTVEPGRPGRR